MSSKGIDFSEIIKESRETLLNPKEYFASMPLEGGFTEPVIRAVIYGIVAGIFALLWSLLGLYDFGLGNMEGAIGIMALISSVIGAIIGVFVGGAVLLIVSSICRGNTDFEANVRVAASLMVIYPINAFLSFLGGIDITLGSLAGLLVNLYAIYLLYNAAIISLNGKESSVKIVAIVLVALSLLGTIGSRRANKAFEGYEDMFREEQVDEADQLE